MDHFGILWCLLALYVLVTSEYSLSSFLIVFGGLYHVVYKAQQHGNCDVLVKQKQRKNSNPGALKSLAICDQKIEYMFASSLALMFDVAPYVQRSPTVDYVVDKAIRTHAMTCGLEFSKKFLGSKLDEFLESEVLAWSSNGDVVTEGFESPVCDKLKIATSDITEEARACPDKDTLPSQNLELNDEGLQSAPTEYDIEIYALQPVHGNNKVMLYVKQDISEDGYTADTDQDGSMTQYASNSDEEGAEESEEEVAQCDTSLVNNSCGVAKVIDVRFKQNTEPLVWANEIFGDEEEWENKRLSHLQNPDKANDRECDAGREETGSEDTVTEFPDDDHHVNNGMTIQDPSYDIGRNALSRLSKEHDEFVWADEIFGDEEEWENKRLSHVHNPAEANERECEAAREETGSEDNVTEFPDDDDHINNDMTIQDPSHDIDQNALSRLPKEHVEFVWADEIFGDEEDWEQKRITHLGNLTKGYSQEYNNTCEEKLSTSEDTLTGFSHNGDEEDANPEANEVTIQVTSCDMTVDQPSRASEMSTANQNVITGDGKFVWADEVFGDEEVWEDKRVQHYQNVTGPNTPVDTNKCEEHFVPVHDETYLTGNNPDVKCSVKDTLVTVDTAVKKLLPMKGTYKSRRSREYQASKLSVEALNWADDAIGDEVSREMKTLPQALRPHVEDSMMVAAPERVECEVNQDLQEMELIPVAEQNVQGGDNGFPAKEAAEKVPQLKTRRYPVPPPPRCYGECWCPTRCYLWESGIIPEQGWALAQNCQVTHAAGPLHLAKPRLLNLYNTKRFKVEGGFATPVNEMMFGADWHRWKRHRQRYESRL